MTTKAKDLKRGDVVRLHVYGEIIAVVRCAEGKRIKVKLALEHQGARGGTLEFTDAGYLMEFICKPGRTFHAYSDYGDDDEGDEPEFSPDPCPETEDA